jgi:hypothetical protein
MHSRILVITIVPFALAACASAPQGTASPGSTSPSTSTTSTAANANRITADQIASLGVATAYDAVDRLHRNWFRNYSSGSSGDVVVYLANQKQDGGKEALRQFPAGDVALLEYLNSTDAVMRFGTDASGGAIIVTRK